MKQERNWFAIFGIKKIETIFMVFLMYSLIEFGLVLLILVSALILSQMYRMLKENYLFDMCTHGKFVTNRYTGVRFWYECGRCKACLQKKAAARSSRIRNEYDGVSNIFFVTLTYDRLAAPYFEQEDFDKLRLEKTRFGTVLSPLNIYRRFSIKWNPNKLRYVKDWSSPCFLESVSVDVPAFCRSELLSSNDDYCRFRWLEKQPKKIGVIYFPDIQNFNKRLRMNLKRLYNYEKKIKIFNCTEYGPKSQRPHAHLLIFARGLSQDAFHAAVIRSWPYGRRIRNKESCQLVFDDPAGYVSSYVNCNSYVPLFLAEYFKPKHSASKFFGHGRKSFLLEEISKKVREGNLTYDLRRITNSGEKILHLPIPKYVINRWYPLFKGYSRLASHTVFEFLSRGFDVGYLYRKSLEYAECYSPRNWIDYSIHDATVRSDLSKIQVRFIHAFENYKKVFPRASLFDYAKAYEATWRCWRSTNYRLFMEDRSVNDFYKYDNIQLLDHDVQLVLHDRLGHGCAFIVDNNKKPHNVNQTILMTEMYDRYDKQKKVSNFCMSEQGILV